LLRLVQSYLIDALPLEAQNIPLDVDSHSLVLCKVSEALYTNRICAGRHPFSLIEPEKNHSPPIGSSSASGCGEPYVRNEANLIEGIVYPISVYACVNPVIRRQMMTRYEMVGAQAALS
jgi:hypothetical protein